MDCGPMPTTVVGGPSMYPPLIGGAGGMTFEDVCPDGMIISALNIDYSPSAGGVTWLEGISAFCGPLQFSRTGSPAQLAVTTGYQYANITPMRGGNGGATILCPVGSVATGLDAGIDPTGPYVRAIDMHCSPIGITGNTAATAVFSFGAPTHLILVINAGPPGTLLPGDCPAGTVARGLRGGYDPLTLWSIGFVCQSITAM
jgi:hypothetical protein